MSDLISPDGGVYELGNVQDFAITFGLHANAVRDVVNGKRIHHKGWMLYPCCIEQREAILAKIGVVKCGISPEVQELLKNWGRG